MDYGVFYLNELFFLILIFKQFNQTISSKNHALLYTSHSYLLLTIFHLFNNPIIHFIILLMILVLLYLFFLLGLFIIINLRNILFAIYLYILIIHSKFLIKFYNINYYFIILKLKIFLTCFINFT